MQVKTTSPDSYRVRPSTGVIKPDSAAEVSVYLIQGRESSIPRDRFLVMAMKVEDDVKSASQVSGLWKTQAKDLSIYMEHRCV